jgi:two-component system, NtrC family, sensor histidine kinase HydH
VLAAAGRESVLVHVDDSGKGVPLADRDRIFEPFFTTKAAGSGLGLPLVHAVATQHGGHVRVEDSPQGGARFTLQLPRA